MAMNFFKWTILLGEFLTLSVACSGGNDGPGSDENTVVSISSPVLSDIRENGVVVKATITTNAASAIVKKGICYATQPNPDITDRTIEMNAAGLALDLALSGQFRFGLFTRSLIHYSRPYVY